MDTVSYFFVKKINKKTLDQPADKFRFVLQELIVISLKLSYNKAWLVKLRAHLPLNIVSKHQRKIRMLHKVIWVDNGIFFKGERTCEPQHETSNNVVYATSKGSDQPAYTRCLVRGFAGRYSMITCIKLLAEHYMASLSLKSVCSC